MNTGLPGTGVGGLFYLLSVVAMILIEIKDFIFMKKRKKHYQLRLVFEQTLLAITIVIAIVSTNIILSTYVFRRRFIPTASWASPVQRSIILIQNHPVVVPIILLTLIIITTQILYFILRYQSDLDRVKDKQSFT